MEHALSCNNLKCRKELTDRALVTTCSHIFCLDCAQQAGAAGNDSTRRMLCPACHSQLTKPDDAIITNLNPTEDYKTSVLSGLGPNVIMECAGRALSFWAYQTAQDVCYQQYLCKTLTEKYSGLSHRLDKTVNYANSEIQRVQQKLDNVLSEQEALRRKNDELVIICKEKTRKLLQTQELYDKVKLKAELGHIQRAASDAVDSTLFAEAQATEVGPSDHEHTEQMARFSAGTGQRLDYSGFNTNFLRSTSHGMHDENQWSRLSMPRRPEHMTTASSNIPRPRPSGHSLATVAGQSASPMPRLSPGRRSFGANASGFAHNRQGLSGLGLTSGLKVSQPTNVAGLDASVRTH
jgi:E3 ubiquitin-protein ligase CCNP1IP1